MIIIKTSEKLKQFLKVESTSKRSIGFVPTMGALHAGHISLVTLCKQQNDLTVVSIFINPLQFNEQKDFENYPLKTEEDIVALIHAGTNILYLPSVQDMYPAREASEVVYELGYLDQILEGAHRPGHFQGVARVVDLLLQTVQPQRLYLGTKDFQQIRIIQRLIDLKGFKTSIVPAPLVREESGLAMSSRNERLSIVGRRNAAMIYQQLKWICDKIREQSFSSLKTLARENLERNGFEVEYIELASQSDLRILKDYEKGIPLVLLAAVRIEGVRLIDNIQL